MKLRAALLAVVLGSAAIIPIASAPSAEAHGWVTSPASRQDNCATGATSFDCGQVKYEPQSVEAPKGSLQCSGGNAAFSILDDASKPWPVTNVGSSIELKWKLTAAHNTSLWEYFLDGKLYKTFDQGGAQPSSTISHSLTNLPNGKHTILARWNVSNTAMAFYSCVDINVTNGTVQPTPEPTPEPTPGPTTPTNPQPGTCVAPAWVAGTAYTSGKEVTSEGHTWKAKWWTQNEKPGASAWGPWTDLGTCAPVTPPTTPPVTTPGDPNARVVGYFTNWGVYGRNYHVKDIETSGSADKLTHILYAFGNVKNGQCTIGDAYADYEKTYTAAQSVDGVADAWDSPLAGNFNQLRKLKALHPDLKVIWSFGGWTWSGGFAQAAANPTAFAKSCRNLVEDPRWADVFDGIDVDWEYPNACGLTCDTSGFSSYKNVMSALRTEFGTDLVTSAIGADATAGGKIDAADYAGGAQYADWIMPMTYDYFGPWEKNGPTAPHSPLTTYPGTPKVGFDSATTITKLTGMGIPSNKLLLGIGFYGKGWTGVTQAAPGGSATGPAAGKYEAGIEDYKELKVTCPPTGTVGGTAYAFCNGNWWSYDTPATITTKMAYAKQQKLGGAFFWELSGDTSNGELITAIQSGLKK